MDRLAQIVGDEERRALAREPIKGLQNGGLIFLVQTVVGSSRISIGARRMAARAMAIALSLALRQGHAALAEVVS